MTLTPSNTAAILLAAGASSRFGGEKLSAPLKGGSVLSHAADALKTAQCAYCAIVLRPGSNLVSHNALGGLTEVTNSFANDGLSTSIRAGVEWADAVGAKGVLIALADMPFVTPDHFAALFDIANKSANACAFTAASGRRSPPALFGAEWFGELKTLSGDTGARKLLSDQPDSSGVAAPESMLIDIDTPDDLEKLQR